VGKKDGKRDSKKAEKSVVAKLPKKKCCVSSTKCNRCPLRMLKEGTLPAGYTVKRRRLVKIEDAAAVLDKGRKKASKEVAVITKKSAAKKSGKKSGKKKAGKKAVAA
jgi:hypothetical protein